jgi:hypothetical protein
VCSTDKEQDDTEEDEGAECGADGPIAEGEGIEDIL